MEEDLARLASLLSRQGNRAYRRYELKRIDGRLTLVRNEVDRIFETALNDVIGCEAEPDDKDGMFFD